MSTKSNRKSKKNTTKKSKRPNKLIVTKVANHSLNRNDITMEDLIKISKGLNKEIKKIKEEINKKITKKIEIETRESEKRKLKKKLDYIDSVKEKEIYKKNDEEINKLLKKLMDFFIDNYLQLSREYKRKHNMKKKYLYEEAMFFEIVIFLILSKYMIGYDNAIKRLLSSGNDLHRLRRELIVYESFPSIQSYKDKLKDINEKRFKLDEKIRDIREGDTGIISLTVQQILSKIQMNPEIDQYFSKLYGNYLSKGENSKSLLLHHINRNFEEETNNNSNYSLDRTKKDMYEHILNLGPKMNELILRSIKNRNNSENTLTNNDILKYNSFEDFVNKKKLEKKKNKKKYKDQEEKLAKIYDFLDPKNNYNNNVNGIINNTNNHNNNKRNKTKKLYYSKSKQNNSNNENIE